MKIVYIEDNFNNLIIIKKILKEIFPEFYTADTGKEGLDIIYKIKPDIALIDLNLPDISGFDIIEQLKKDGLINEITSIAISGFTDKITIKQVYESGFDGFVEKPVNIDNLISYLLKVHNQKKFRKNKNENQEMKQYIKSNQQLDYTSLIDTISHELKTPITSLLIKLKSGETDLNEITASLEEYITSINKTIDFIKTNFEVNNGNNNSFTITKLISYLENNHNVSVSYLLPELTVYQNFELIKYLFDTIINFVLSSSKDTNLELLFSYSRDLVNCIIEKQVEQKNKNKIESNHYLTTINKLTGCHISFVDNKPIIRIPIWGKNV